MTELTLAERKKLRTHKPPKPKGWKIGDEVILPDMGEVKIAGMQAMQHPRDVGQKGKIIAVVYVGDIPVPRIRLTGGRIIHGYECWWKPLRAAIDAGKEVKK